MAHQDLNSLFENLHRSRPVYVSEDGAVEDEGTAQQREANEAREGVESKPRTRLKPEVWGADDSVVRCALSALVAMHEEAARYPGETGGILVGPDPFTIGEFLPSGAAAERTRSSWRMDPEALQPKLDDAHDRGLRFVGVAHTHPRGCNALSAIDVEAASRILDDPEWATDTLVLPLGVRADGGFLFTFSIIDRTSRYPRPARLEVLAENVATATIRERLFPTPTAAAAAKQPPSGAVRLRVRLSGSLALRLPRAGLT